MTQSEYIPFDPSDQETWPCFLRKRQTQEALDVSAGQMEALIPDLHRIDSPAVPLLVPKEYISALAPEIAGASTRGRKAIAREFAGTYEAAVVIDAAEKALDARLDVGPKVEGYVSFAVAASGFSLSVGDFRAMEDRGIIEAKRTAFGPSIARTALDELFTWQYPTLIQQQLDQLA